MPLSHVLDKPAEIAAALADVLASDWGLANTGPCYLSLTISPAGSMR